METLFSKKGEILVKRKILIVEDEHDIIQLIANRLDKNQYNITTTDDGAKALELVRRNYYDLISLDIMLPHVDGLTICNEIRQNYKDTIIVTITALDTELHREQAYSLGADDYIAKPFSPKLVALKIDTLLKRRFELTHAHLLFFNHIQHHNDLRLFYIKGKRLNLTLSEYTILRTLFETPQRVFSKDELSQILYNEDIGNIDRNGIGTHIYQLRKKIAKLCDEPMIKTIRNIGYTLYET